VEAGLAEKVRVSAELSSPPVFVPVKQITSLITAALFFATALSIASAAQVTAAALLPMPREYSARDVLSLDHGVSITSESDSDDHFAAQDLAEWLKELNVSNTRGHSSASIELLRTQSHRAEKLLSQSSIKIDASMHDEGYAIVPTEKGLAVIADTSAGIFYGEQTIKQMVAGNGSTATLQRALIRDWPAMRYRGISDDLSRGPFPTLEFQKSQIRTLAAYKINIYSPYFENTLQYPSNPVPGLPGGSMSPEDVRELVEYARPYHITIIPEQEAFGHLHHVLKYEQYAPLAETPMGNVLAPGQPGSLDLIGQWFSEIAAAFPGPFLHIGADETADLGKGQTHAAVESQGLGPTYVDFLLRIHEKLAPLNRRLLFWGDIAMNDPPEVKRLPKDMIAVAWTYSPEPDGFGRWLKPYVDAGMETWVAPGVNNWSRVYPDNDYALRNIQGFVRDGQAAHSTGVLNTVWNDDGEGLFQADWYGVLFGAAAGWQPGSSDLESFQNAYGNLFHGDRTGDINQAQRELIAIYQSLDQAKVRESTDALFWADPWNAEGQAVAVELRPLVHEMRLHAERAITLLAQARAAGPLRETDAIDAMELGARKLDFIGQKFETADRIASLYNQAYSWQSDALNAKRIGGNLGAISSANGLCEDMRDGYSYTRLQYSQLWLRENRPYWLQNVLVRYDLATQLWVQRSARFQAARDMWREHHKLPAPAELGIPLPQGD
jgi:hexosaminidase